MTPDVKTQNTTTWSSSLHWLSLILFHTLVLTVPFLFTWVNDELFEFNKMMAVYVLGGLIIATWVGRMIVEKRLLWHRSPLDWAVLAFGVSQVFATLLSINVHTSVWGYYSRFHGGLVSTFMYLGIYFAATTTFTTKNFTRLWVSLILGAVFSALYALPEHFGHSPSCYLITSGQQFGVDCWIQDVQSRVFGTFGQPNWLAAYLIMIIPVATTFFVHRVREQTDIWARLSWLIISWLVLGELTAVTLYTQSRSGVLGLGAGLVVWLLFTARSEHKRRQPLLSQNWFLGGLTWISIGTVMLLNGTPYTPAIASLFHNQSETVAPTPAPVIGDRLGAGGTDSGEIRRIVWDGAIKVWQRYPLFGSGVETFAYSYYQDRPMAHNTVSEWDFLYNKAHNEFLNFLATTGLFGFSTYLAVLLISSSLTFLGIQKIAKNQSSQATQTYLPAYLAAIVAVSISNFFGFSTVMITVILYLFLAAITLSYSSHKLLPPSENTPLLTWQKISIGLLVIVSIGWVWQVRNFWLADFLFSQAKTALKLGSVQTAVLQYEKAVQLLPNEALYYDELAATYGDAAAALATRGDATSASQIANAAIAYSDQALTLNNRHLNFYKTRARLFISLAQFDERYLAEAQKTLQAAITLSPTDAKLVYNLGLVEMSMGATQSALAHYQQAITMKPNYESARAELGKYYEDLGDFPKALEQYSFIIEQVNPNNQPILERLNRIEASISAQTKN